jgi:hypothetical protein
MNTTRTATESMSVLEFNDSICVNLVCSGGNSRVIEIHATDSEPDSLAENSRTVSGDEELNLSAEHTRVS